MSLRRLRALIVLLMALGAMWAAHAWHATTRLSDTHAKVDLEQMFPVAFGDWKVDTSLPVQLVSPDLQKFIATVYNQTLNRTYVNSQGQRIMLSVAYGGDQSDATRAHRPEVCYPAQGFQILGKQDVVISTGNQPLRVRHLQSRMGSRIEPISYWITVGERVTLSGTEQKLAQLSYSTRGVIPDGMLVRVSSIDADTQAAYRVQSQFIAQLSQAVPLNAKKRVFGDGSA